MKQFVIQDYNILLIDSDLWSASLEHQERKKSIIDIPILATTDRYLGIAESKGTVKHLELYRVSTAQ